MKNYTATAGAFLRTLSECLGRDPASVDGWCCIHLPGLLAGQEASAKLALLDAHLSALEGSLVMGIDGDTFILYRGIGKAGHGRLVYLIQESLDLKEAPLSKAYELFHEWPMVKQELLRQSALLGTQLTPVSSSYMSVDELAGIRHMSEVLRDSKFTRTYRDPMTVLLVEDDPVTCRLAGKLLSREHVLVTAGNAYEAVVNYLLYAPEIVFLDINLPDQSGFSVLDQLTACDPDAYVVMFSGNDGIENIVDSMQRGAQGFVVKPFQRDRLKHFLVEREQGRSRKPADV